MDSRGPFGFRGSLQDRLMAVSDKTNVLIVPTASGTETERKKIISLLKKSRNVTKERKEGYKCINMIHSQD